MTLTDFLSGIAHAIRQKTGSSSPIPAPNFADEILGIQTGVDTSDATATAGDILSGKTAYGSDGKITGTIPTAQQATPAISVSNAGLITATSNQATGYVSGGQLSAQQQLDTQPQAEITPGTSSQTAVSAGKYTTGDITVAGDSNLVPSNIKSGVSIFGVAGTAEVLDTPSAKIEITNESYSRMYVIYQKPGFLSWDAASFYGYGSEVVTVPVGGWIYAYSEDGFPYVESRNGCSLVGPGPNNEHNLVEVTATSGSVSFSVY